MTRLIVSLLLLLTWLPAMAEEPAEPEKGYTLKRLGSAEEQKPKPEFTQEHFDQMKAAEEKYKDNPAVLDLIGKLKEGMGMTEDPETAREEPPPPPKHISTVPASREDAHAAYSRKDYATALEQYKALAAAGDPEASAIVGMMYEGGIGTDADPVAAQAWYKRAAESGEEDNRFSKVVTDKTVDYYEDHRLSGEDTAQANQLREEIDQEISIYGAAKETDGAKTEAGTGAAIKIRTYAHYPDTGPGGKSHYAYMAEPRAARISPTKMTEPGYLRPRTDTQPGHLQPEKFIRQPATGGG